MFMIAHGASVVIVRDGTRKTILANTGADFTEEEIASVNRSAPGALRKPINEGRNEADAEADKPKGKKAGGNTKQEAPAATETAAQKKKRLAAEKKAAEAAAAAGDDDDDDDNAGDDNDADEDEDI